MRTLLSLVLGVAVVAPAGCRAPADDKEKEPTLTAEDKTLLDGLFKDFLFDPTGAERVSVKATVRTVWAASREAEVEGWLVPGKDGKPGRVYFTDGGSIPAPPEKAVKKVDFKAACKARYSPAPKKPDDKGGPDRDDTFRKMELTAVGAVSDDDLALAAWLYRLGDEPLAAKALAEARKGTGRGKREGKEEDPRERLRDQLAWSAFAGMVHAYMVRADEEALAHGERLLKLYPEAVKDGKEYKQAGRIVDDLKRRKKAGTFGKEPAGRWPDGFDTWEAGKKAAYLIDALDEVDARQWGQPGGVDLASDRRVEALIELGDAAVPALLDALESDERLTRSVHFWRDFSHSRTVLGVREAVLTAVMSVLRVRVFEPVATGDNFTARGEDEAKETAKRLRAYWKEYGGLPFDERMMRVLTDTKTTFEAKREAAENLASLTEDRRLRTTIYPTVVGSGKATGANPAVAKFSKPTAAEAILAAMDADLKAFDAEPSKDEAGYRDYKRRGLEGTYLSALVELGDGRVAAEAAKRAADAKTLRGRRQWAQVAHILGDPKPFRAFAEDFRAGKVEVPADADDELAGVLRALIGVGTPEAEGALATLADPKHPQHAAIAKQVLTRRPGWSDDRVWFAHPLCLSVLRHALDDTTPTGAKYVIEDGRLWHKAEGSSSGGGVPEFLREPAVRHSEAAERACDAAAEKLGELVVGLPLYHPLFKDADERLKAVKAAFDRFAGKYRPATGFEGDLLGRSPFTQTYVPDIKPLGRAATAADVKAGVAVFHLDGKGKPADLKLPAAGVLKRDEKDERAAKVIVVQAEAGPDGAVTYGVLSKEGVRAVPAADLSAVKPFEQLAKEEEDARKEREKEREKAKGPKKD